MKLIINGDDFGITPACNETIIDCYRKGRLTSCSLMTNMPAAKEAAGLWKQNPGLSVGLHVCLTAGRPLTRPASLMKEDGTFDKSIWAGGQAIDLQEMETEIQAQFDRFVELTGKKPEHLDSHHGIERIPGAAAIMERLSGKYHIPLRMFMPPTETGPVPCVLPRFCPAGSADDCLLSPEDFLQELTRQAEDAQWVELALHPGKADSDLAALSSLCKGREADAANLLSDDFGAFLERPDIDLVFWRDVPERTPEPN